MTDNGVNDRIDSSLLSQLLDNSKNDIDTDNDGVISPSEAAAVKVLDLSSANLSTLEGIECFANLTELNCSNNKISSLDISGSTKIAELNCSNNQLTSLNLTSQKQLGKLVCYGNKLTKIDLSNTKLSNTQTDAVLDCSPMNDSNGNNLLEYLFIPKGVVLNYINGQGAYARNDDYVPKETKIFEGSEAETFCISKTSFSVPYSGEDIGFTIICGTSYNVSSKPSWVTEKITRAITERDCTFTVAANPTATSREGKIVFTDSKGQTRSVTITQQAAPVSLSLSASDWSTSSAAASKSVQLTSNRAWTASSDSAWCQVSPSSGSGNGTLTVTVSANTSPIDRSATVTVTAGSKTETIAVSQQAAPVSLSLSASDWSTSSAAASKSVQLTSNSSWTASSDSAWCQVSPSSGSGNGTLTVSVTANTSPVDRSATVTVTVGSKTKTIAVSQEASVGNNNEHFDENDPLIW